LVSDGVLTPPALDLDGYQDCLHRCRNRFPGLRIMSGVELSEPHWHSCRAATLLRDGGFDRVLAAVHSAPTGTGFNEISGRFRDQAPAQVLHGYSVDDRAVLPCCGNRVATDTKRDTAKATARCQRRSAVTSRGLLQRGRCTQ
jgi:hypothetical protein